MDDRRDGVEESERSFSGQLADRLGERGRGEGAGGDDDAVPVGRRQPTISSRRMSIQRCAVERLGDRRGEAVAVDGQRAAGGQLVGVGARHHQRAEPAHLGMQQADGARLRVVGAERVGADELGEVVGLVRGGRSEPAASRAAPPARRGARSARRPRSPARPPPMTWIGAAVGRWLGIRHRLKLGAASGSAQCRRPARDRHRKPAVG